MAPPITTDQMNDMLDLIDVMEMSLDGDGSTAYMGDVTPSQAVQYVLRGLNRNGYAIVKVKG